VAHDQSRRYLAVKKEKSERSEELPASQIIAGVALDAQEHEVRVGRVEIRMASPRHAVYKIFPRGGGEYHGGSVTFE
jgi:hypothetical protein